MRGLEEFATEADIQFINTPLSEHSFQAALLDPPRSGLGLALKEFLEHPTCSHIVYVSCNFKSMKHDMEQLFQAGYKLKTIKGIDQFPKSNHCEWVAYFVKDVFVTKKENREATSMEREEID